MAVLPGGARGDAGGEAGQVNEALSAVTIVGGNFMGRQSRREMALRTGDSQGDEPAW